MKKIYYILLISLLSINLATAQQTEVKTDFEVGTLPGSFNVSSGGAATYTVPIKLPEGRAGFTPTLSLNYNSQGGNKLLGMRWALGGLSTINRTGTNMYNENFIDGVDFDDNDRFQLDGQRLIPVSETMTVYRTERETFSKIVVHGSNVDNPDWFEVFTKDGRIIEYGKNYNSQIIPSDKTETLVWQISRIKDRQGNYIDFYYDHGNEIGKIIEIKYTGNLRNNIVPFYNVLFEYVEREDNSKQYISGGFIEQHSLLEKITIKYGIETLQSYTLNYNHESLFPKLESITTSDNDGTELNPTFFEYGLELQAFSTTTTDIDDNGQNVDYTMGDFNGDGNTDIVCAYYTIDNGVKNYGACSVFYSNGDGSTFERNQMDDLTDEFMYFIPGDFNGDGLEDLVRVYIGVFTYFLSEGNGFSNSGPSKTYTGVVHQISPGTLPWHHTNVKSAASNTGLRSVDVNGNGKAEIMVVNYDLGGGNAIMYSYELDENKYNVHSIFFYDNGSPNLIEGNVFQYSSTDLNPVAAGDYTGDGKTNLVLNTEPNKSIILELDEDTTMLIEINENGYDYPTNNTTVQYVGDFNGDGIADLFTTVDGIWAVRYFNGKTGWVTGSPIPTPEAPLWYSYGDFQYAFSDFNGDGKTDVLQVYQEYYFDPHTMNEPEFIKSHWDMHYSNGTEFEKEEYFPPFAFPKTIYQSGVQFLDVNGDGKSECMMSETYEGRAQIMFFHKDEQVYNIQKITDGLGAETKITYELITNSDAYTKETIETYPIISLQYPLLVVTKSEKDNGISGFFEQTYQYKGLKAHQMGIGGLGFQELVSTDKRNNIQTITSYTIINDNNLHYYKYPSKIIQHPLQMNGDVNLDEKVTETENIVTLKNTLSGKPKVYYPVFTESVDKYWDNESNNTFIKMVTTTQPITEIDSYGNSTGNTVVVSDNESGTWYTRTTYESRFDDNMDIINWIIGRPDYTKVVNEYVNDTASNVMRTDYTYYDIGEPEWPLLEIKQITPNNNSLYANHSLFNYNIYGNIIKTTVSALDLSVKENPPTISKETIFDYSEDNNYNGRFLTAVIKDDGTVTYTNEYAYNPLDGTLQNSTDASGLVTEYDYGNFGRLNQTTYPDQSTERISIFWKDDSFLPLVAPENSVYANVITNADKSIAITFKDKLGRELRTLVTGLHDEWICSDKIYNTRGLISKVSEPYFSPDFPDVGDDEQWTTYMRNGLNNKIGSVITPSNTVNITYTGLETNVTNMGAGVSKSALVDPLGRKLAVTDPAGNITYTYFSSGNLKSTDALGSITEIFYDVAGRQTLIIEPNMGETEYLYSNFGELLVQTDNKDNTYKMEYDLLGRLSKKTLENTSEVTTYNYYNTHNENGFGMLESIIGSEKINYEYTYDKLNRLETETEVIDGINYKSIYSYNSIGQLDRFTYPSQYSIQYQYTNTGSLYQVIDGKIEDKILWQADAINRRGQITNFSLGNGLSTEKGYNDLSGLLESIVTGQVQNLEYNFDPVTGNLNWRKDNRYYLTERFTYDALLQSRLETWSVNRGEVFAIGYEVNGNVISKSDVTSWEPPGKYQYGQNAGLNAVTDISNPTLPYMERATPQKISYTEFNKLNQIRQTNIENDDEHVYSNTIEYGPDNARKKSTLYKDRGISKIKHFVGINYEVEINSDGEQRKLHYISGLNGLFAIYVQSGVTDTMYYIQKDHLGSYYCITNEDGNIIVLGDDEEQVYNFDPWGRRRNATDWSFNDVPTSFLFDRGYTGHEHLDKFDLINMNGRCYDPWLGRMLSSDPFLQAPTNSQNYNRYSYAYNNPLKYTDPSGYISMIEFKIDNYKIIGGGFMYRNSYYGYDSFTDKYYDNSGSPISTGAKGYRYDFTSGKYKDQYGSDVGFSQVMQNYVGPNSDEVWVWGIIGGHSIGSPTISDRGYVNGDPNFVTDYGWYNDKEVHPSKYRSKSGCELADVGITLQEAGTAVGAFGVANGVKTNLVEWGMKGADWGKAGAKYLKFVKRAGTVGFVVNVGISGYGSYDYYYNQNGTDWQVGAKATLDVAMGAAAFVWPIGTAISGSYFILDASTGGFGGWGDPYKP